MTIALKESMEFLYSLRWIQMPSVIFIQTFVWELVFTSTDIKTRTHTHTCTQRQRGCHNRMAFFCLLRKIRPLPPSLTPPHSLLPSNPLLPSPSHPLLPSHHLLPSLPSPSNPLTMPSFLHPLLPTILLASRLWFLSNEKADSTSLRFT